MQKTVSLTVNGKTATATVEGRTLLVQLLREHLGLTGTHVGCDTSQCGACVVHINGEAVKSCTILAVQCEGADVLTIEGVANGDQLHPMQEAFRNNHALQCGFCTPGMVMSALDLVKNNPNPSEREVREYLEGNLCRCTGYHNIVLAIIEGAAVMRGEAPPRQSPRSGGGVAAMPDDRPASPAARGLSVPDRTGNLYRRHQPAGAGLRLSSCAARMPMRGSTAIDTSAAASAPGVVAVFTGKDMAADEIGGLPCGWLINSKDGSPMAEPPHPVLAVDRVRHVGDPVAVVIAESLGQARDAAEQIAVDYAVEPAVVDPAEALKPGAPQVWPEQAPGNICYDWHLGDQGAVDAAIARAARVVKLDLINNRLVPNAMEPRAAIGEFDRATNEYTLYTTSQNPHVIRLLMGAFVLHIPEARLRVVAPDVGGGFGSKIYHYAEEAIVTWAAGKVRKPVKWTAERSESFMSDAHGRDHVTHVELALDDEREVHRAEGLDDRQYGRLSLDLRDLHPDLSVRHAARRHLHDPGDLCRDQGGVHQHRAGRCLSRRRAARGDVPAGAHRRSRGRRTGDRPGRIAPPQLHPGRRLPVPDAGRAAIRQRRLPDDPADGAASGRLRRLRGAPPGSRERAASMRGIGIATYIEACGIAPSAVVGSLGARAGLFESAAVRVHPTGSVTVLTGSHATARGTRRPSRSLSPTISACRSRRSRSSTATPPRSRTAWAPTARARWRSAAARSSRRWTR